MEKPNNDAREAYEKGRRNARMVGNIKRAQGNPNRVAWLERMRQEWSKGNKEKQ